MRVQPPRNIHEHSETRWKQAWAVEQDEHRSSAAHIEMLRANYTSRALGRLQRQTAANAWGRYGMRNAACWVLACKINILHNLEIPGLKAD